MNDRSVRERFALNPIIRKFSNSKMKGNSSKKFWSNETSYSSAVTAPTGVHVESFSAD